MKSLRQALNSVRRAVVAGLGALVALGLVVGGLIALTPAPAARAAARVCDPYGTTTIQSTYILQNNRYGTAETQCVEEVGTDGGFRVAQADGSVPISGTPKSYPSIYNGCYDNVCSPGTSLPMRLSAITRARTTANFIPVYSGAVFDASYHIWLDPTARRDGVNRLEIAVRFQSYGAPLQPVGSRIGTVYLAGIYWDVWTGGNGSNDVISFVAPRQVINWDFDVKTFTNEAVRRGLAGNDWYLTSVQASFDTWENGAGLTVSCFKSWVNEGEGSDDGSASYGYTDGFVFGTTGGSATGGSTTSGGTTSGGTVTGGTSGSTAGTTTIGGTSGGPRYCPYRDLPLTTGGTTTGETTTSTVGGGTTSCGSTAGCTTTGTTGEATTGETTTAGGSTVTGGSSTTTGTTGEATTGETTTIGGSTTAGGSTTIGGSTGGSTGGSGSSSCKVTYSPQTWPGGFTADVTIANTGSSAVNGWRLGFTLPPGATVTSAWNATVSPASGALTATNAAYNAQIPVGGSQSFGFQGTSTGGTAVPTGFTLNGTVCS